MNPNAHILLVEDDDSLREILSMTLEDHSYAVDQAPNGQRALEMYDPKKHEVVLTDMRMPGMNGLELMDRLLAISPDAVILVLTAFGGPQGALDSVRRGAFHYVEKPVNTRALLNALERAVGHAREVSGSGPPSPSAHTKQSKLIAVSPSMNRVLHIVDRVADSDAPVMIVGESGVGKDLVARSIHERSNRSSKPFVAINCAAIPAELLESMLFGHEKGAFTGAATTTKGKFIQADHGTLFLDEIAEMSPQLQSKLLRVVQDGMVERVGSATPQRVNVRLVCATHQDLKARIQQGTFRKDLYYRLCVIPIDVPPLRHRVQDIPVLMRHFLRELAPSPELSFSTKVDEVFMRYAWPGNIRELKNVVERMVLLRNQPMLSMEDVPEEMLEHTKGAAISDGALPFPLPEDGLDLKALERQIIVSTLIKMHGNQSAAARYLNIPRHVLTYRLEKFDISQYEYNAQTL